MAVLDLVYYPDNPLMLKAGPVTKFDGDLESVVADMFETMHAYEGVGLAAPQIGRSERFFILREPGEPEGEEMCFVNPEISGEEGAEEGEEGCLSIPRVYAMVTRATRVIVKAQDVHGKPFELEARDFLARIILHEYDHLEGVSFPDRLDIITRQSTLEEWAGVRKELLAEADRPEPEHAS